MGLLPLTSGFPNERRLGAITKFSVTQGNTIEHREFENTADADESLYLGGEVTLPGISANKPTPFHTLISRIRVRVGINGYWGEESGIPNGWARIPKPDLRILTVSKEIASQLLDTLTTESTNIEQSDAYSAARFESQVIKYERIIEVGFPVREISTFPNDNDFRGVNYRTDGAQYDRTQTGLTENYPYINLNPFSKYAPPIDIHLPWQPYTINSNPKRTLWTVTSPEEETGKHILTPNEVLLYAVRCPLLYVNTSTSIPIIEGNLFSMMIDVSGMYAANLEDLIPYV